MTYKELQEKSGIKVGNKVIITRAAEHDEQGWPDNWQTDMDAYIGETVTVKSMGKLGVRVKENIWTYPCFVLEIVKKKGQE